MLAAGVEPGDCIAYLGKNSDHYFELLLGAALILGGRRSAPIGVVVAGFFIVIFPGNIAQFVEAKNGFGLDTDEARAFRLLFQPVLVAWALWSTGAWAAWRAHRAKR